MLRFCLAFYLALLSISCGTSPPTVEDFSATKITLPDGAVIVAESMRKPKDVVRGMMFRDVLPADRGMILFFASAGQYPFWPYQVRLPLDVVWLDKNRSIVEIMANVPPCLDTKSANNCQTYGGHQPALFIVEMGAGLAAKHGLALGRTLSW